MGEFLDAANSARSQRRREGDSASSPVSNPVSKPRVLDGGDAETR
jgi:hypothetical protein